MLAATYDSVTGIVTCKAGGFYTVDYFEQFTHDVSAMSTRAKREKGRVKILIHAEGLPVQSADVANVGQRITSQTGGLIGPDDRIAMILSSNLSKIQMSRVMVNSASKCFLSEAEAVAWLMSDC
ncbi:MAG TPA: hypothetical protein VF503_13025 [Sphingobium sp.]|uniref:hypothetical protein n=1 Tax=Sphingobium sp. TaxID=1912891 RepID=UPI002ED54582